MCAVLPHAGKPLIGRVCMLDREHLETFAAVADTQSFERAALLLSISRGAVSQRIKALEEAVTTVLLLREKPVRLTPSGEVLLRHVKAMRLLEASAMRELSGRHRTSGLVPLAIAVNADSLATWFKPLLLDLFAKHAVALEILTEDENHAVQHLHRGEVVGCISTDSKAAAGFRAQPLGAMEYRCYASPALAAQFLRKGLGIEEALNAPAVLLSRKDSLHDQYLRQQLGVQLERYPRHYLPTSAALLEGIAMGAGYGLVPTSQAGRMVQAGLIQEVQPSLAMKLQLFWHHWQTEPPVAHQITELVLQHARCQLVQHRGSPLGGSVSQGKPTSRSGGSRRSPLPRSVHGLHAPPMSGQRQPSRNV